MEKAIRRDRQKEEKRKSETRNREREVHDREEEGCLPLGKGEEKERRVLR